MPGISRKAQGSTPRGGGGGESSIARLERFLDALPSIAASADLAEAVVDVSRPLGLDTIMAGAVNAGSNPVRARFYFGNWPPDWMALYTAELLAADPLLGEAKRRLDPFTWSELRAEGQLAPEMNAAFETGRQAGWSDGFAVPIHGPAGYIALVSFAGRDLGLTALDRALLRSLAHAAHDHGRRLRVGDDASPELKLTNREREVMRWVASGKSDWEIGRILGISESTAHFHVEQVKRKLKAPSRAEAVGVLLMQGL